MVFYELSGFRSGISGDAAGDGLGQLAFTKPSVFLGEFVQLGHIADHPNIDVFGMNHPDPNRALSSLMAISLSRALPSRMASTIASNS